LKFPAAFTPALREATGEVVREIPEVRIPEVTEKIFLDNYAPTFAIIDEKYRLVYVRGRTGKYLEIASGQPNLSILEMAREGLRSELASAVYRASSEKKPVLIESLRVKTNGSFQNINLTVAPIGEHGIPSGFLMIVFQEIGSPSEGVPTVAKPKKGHQKTGLEQELKLTKENLQTTIEELEATNEELKSANEELQSNNEELQSTNEELDTSREEMQSLNEELTTVNAELRDKNEQLIRVNDDLKNFLNRTDIAIIFLDEELKIRSYTPATSDVFNIREIDIGRPLEDITSQLAYEKVASDAKEVLRNLQPKEVEVRRKDGSWYKMRILPYRTTQNEVNGLVISFLDINAQKKATALLRETKDYLENLINYANAPIIVWNSNLVITRFNHAFERLAGRKASEVLGNKVDIIFPPGKLDAILQQIHLVVAKGTRWEVVEIPIQQTDGSIRTVLWNSATIYDADGITPIATIAQGQDITERKKAEEELQHYTAELEVANKELEAFSYSVSHDLRAPLRALDGFSEAIEMDYRDKLDEKGRDYLNRIRQASQTMSRLIDDLLNLSRFSRLKLETEKVNLSELVDSTGQKLQASQRERQVEFKIEPKIIVEGDRRLLKILTTNLLENSWKFTSKKPQAKIEFGIANKDGKAVYFVKDNGAGFNMNYADKLFKPFQRLHPAREFPGTGVGLATVQRIVRRHGGTIWAESELGKGATFYFTLGSGNK
jgi:two-component system, chemotaxis family, CheB/CheR fusion protein